MTSRPELELTVDLRSYERIAVVSGPDSTLSYPEKWVKLTRSDLNTIDPETIVLIDRVDVQRRTLESIAEKRPRLIVMAPTNVEQEKSMRRLVTSTFPWAESWTIFTSFGKVLVTKDVIGASYERETVIDMRRPAEA